MKTYIFACVHNAGRSQMAAAWLRQLARTRKAHAVSAGTQPGTRVHPEVLEAMREVGVDLSAAVPQKLTDELARGANMLITMGCGEACPYVPGLRREDWPLEDPKGKPVERVREIRDEVRGRIRTRSSASSSPRLRPFRRTPSLAVGGDDGNPRQRSSQNPGPNGLRQGREGRGRLQRGLLRHRGERRASPWATRRRTSRACRRAPTSVSAAATRRRSRRCARRDGARPRQRRAASTASWPRAGSGATGRVIGVDMTPEMVTKARDNARRVDATNVEFRLGRDRAPAGRRTRRSTSSSRTASSTCRPTRARCSARRSACSSRADASRSPTSSPPRRCRRSSRRASRRSPVASPGAASIDDMRALLTEAGFESVRDRAARGEPRDHRPMHARRRGLRRVRDDRGREAGWRELLRAIMLHVGRAAMIPAEARGAWSEIEAGSGRTSRAAWLPRPTSTTSCRRSSSGCTAGLGESSRRRALRRLGVSHRGARHRRLGEGARAGPDRSATSGASVETGAGADEAAELQLDLGECVALFVARLPVAVPRGDHADRARRAHAEGGRRDARRLRSRE